MDIDQTIGTQIRRIRRARGMTQQQLAGLAGISDSFLSDIERGRKGIETRRTLEGLTRALRVAPQTLTGSPFPPTGDPVSSDGHAALRGIEDVLATLRLGSDPELRSPRPWPDLAAEVTLLTETLHVQADYTEAGARLPDLIQHLHWSYVHRRAERREVLVALIHAARLAAVITKNLGAAGFPVLAGRLAEDCARELDDPIWAAFVAWLRGFTEGERDRPHQYRLSVAALDAMPPTDDPDAHQAAGMLHLHAALAKAAQADAARAEEHLGEARDLAARLPDHHRNLGMWFFSPANVGIWHVALGVELGYGPRVAEIADGVHPEAVPARARQAMYFADLGRALITDRRTRERGLHALVTAERTAPQRIRNNPFVRDAVATLLTQTRRQAGDRDLRGLAYRMGVVPIG